MSKKARERKNEELKAERSLGGARMKDGSSDMNKMSSGYAIELQWFKLLRGRDRLVQIASILVELAPSKVFDPRNIYKPKSITATTTENENADEHDEKDKSSDPKKKKKEEKPKKLSKKEQLIAANSARMQKEAAERDAEKLRTLGNRSKGEIKLSTESGKLLLLLQNLRDAVADQNTVDILDTLWEIEEIIQSDSVDEDSTAAALKQYFDTVKEARRIRSDKAALGGQHIVEFQLTKMSDRLPPLNEHALQGKFQLDPWQSRVLDLIQDDKKSILITAPTSSGKTVLSTYVCTSGVRVLFVVPTEPLAWQVAAMMRALKLGVSLVVPTLTFVPPQWDVCVGTPYSLESALTKQVGFDFDWAIFDEVHSLNNRGGDALQRLIRAVPSKCRFLALSATIGNAVELKNWWETIVGVGNVELVQHQARFINLQRHVWTGETNTGTNAGLYPELYVKQLHFLHPCVCLNVDHLKEQGFGSTDMALTPIDSFRLWKAFEKYLGKMETPIVPIKDLKPRKYFEFDDQEKTRITLAQSFEYEKALKERLEKLAKQDTQLTKDMLASLASATATPGSGVDEKSSSSEQGKNVSSIMNQSATADSAKSLCDLCFALQKKELLPAIVFQLDSVRCQGYFESLLGLLEAREEATYPDYRAKLLAKQRGIEKMIANSEKGQRKRVDEEDEMEAQQFGEASNANAVDVDAPHPDFSLSPPGKGMGATELADVQQTLKGDLPPYGSTPHPLIRALRRGIGMYIEGLPAAYHRIVQSFAQKGRLGIVFSDELLAYGVNMPFRSAVFFGDPGREWLTPLIHQQMAGRAGRRGLDRQGHLIYCGFQPARLQELLRGELPAVRGVYPLYPTIPLQQYMNEIFESAGVNILDENKMKMMCGTPLSDYLEKDKKSESYYENALAWVSYLKLKEHTPSSYSHYIPELVWELRQYVAESVALEYLLEPMIARYKNIEVIEKGDGDAQHQYAIMLLFCQLCARKPFDSSIVREGYGPLPSPHQKDESWFFWSNLIKESQDRILNSSIPGIHKEQLLLKYNDSELSNELYAAFIRNQIDPKLPTPVQHELRERLWDVGEVLRICSNVLGRASALQPLQNVIRKCFLRIRYILDETFERNWSSVTFKEEMMPKDRDDRE